MGEHVITNKHSHINNHKSHSPVSPNKIIHDLSTAECEVDNGSDKIPIFSTSASSNEQFLVSSTLKSDNKTVTTHAMIDSGAMSCFVHTDFIKEHGLPSIDKTTPIEVQTVDGRPISSGLVTQESL